MISTNIKQNNLSKKSRYRPEIDGLRAFAVIAVIINHFNKEILPGGYLGVDIFFVISGFVITSSLYQRPSKNFKDFIIGFYERRIKRLVPALSAFVLVMSVAICLFNKEPGISLKTGLTSLFGLSNIFLLQKSTDYFALSTELNVFTHTWSLGVEEQFYIIFPFLIWFSGFGRQTKSGPRNLFLIVGSLTIASLISFCYLYPTNQPAAYFLMPTRFWEMASGCLLFIGFQERKSIEQFLEKVPPILILACLIGVMYLPMSLATTSKVTVVVLSLVLIASLKKGTASYTFFTNSKVVYIGLISYSLYLWHWGVLSISRWTIGIHWWSIPFQVSLILGIAIASYRYIETPLRKETWFRKRWKTIVAGGGVIVAVAGSLIALGKPLDGKLYIGKKNTSTIKFSSGEKCLENISKYTKCYFIDNGSQQTLWILGDSHAGSFFLSGEKVGETLGMNFKLYSAASTTFPPINKYQKTAKIRTQQTLKDVRLVEKELYKQMKFGDVILLSMRIPFHFGGTYYENPPSEFVFIRKDGSFGSQENSFDEWIASVVKLANIAQKKGTKVIIQTPNPEWEKEHLNKRCSTSNRQWFNSLNKTNCQIKSNFFIDKKTGLYKHLFEKLNKLSSSHKNIYLFDTYKIVCPKSICSFAKNGADIYRDDDHISYEWAKDFLAPEIYKFINGLQNIDKSQ